MSKPKQSTTEQLVTIPAIRLGSITAEVEGGMPLIANRFSDRAQSSIKEKQGMGAKPARAARDPEAEFLAARYIIEEGKFGFPGIGLQQAMVAAGKFAQEKMTILRGALSVPADLIPIISPNPPIMRSDRVRLSGQGRVTSIAYRPMWWPWKMEVPIVFDMDVISQDQVVNLLQRAGFSIGIGAWRRTCSGNFGMFKVISVNGKGAVGSNGSAQ